MNLNWLIPSTLVTFFVVASPAHAAKLQSWRFDRQQNQLEFITQGGVQPQAQLVFNPTRLVIDLPGTEFGRPQLTQNLGGTISAIRVGQFDPNTSRIVVDIAPGYTINPQDIKFSASSANRWLVKIPNPQVENRSNTSTPDPQNIYTATSNTNTNTRNNNTPLNPPPRSNPSFPRPDNPRVISAVDAGTLVDSLRVTGDGFYLHTRGNGNPRIEVERSSDRRTINVDIKGATRSPNLPASMIINKHGVKRIDISQTESQPPTLRLTMQVDRNSSDWRASRGGANGLIILPGTPSNENTNTPPIASGNYPIGGSRPIPTIPVGNINNNGISDNGIATIQAIDISPNGSQLNIRSNGRINPTGGWDRSTGLYRVTISNARLMDRVGGPSLSANSPVMRIRLQQQDANTVVVLIQPAPGVQVGNISQLNPQVAALSLNRSAAITPPIVLPPIRPEIPQPGENLPQPPTNTPPQPQPRQPQPRGKVVIVVDPGHGGKDSGAPGLGGLLEKDVVLPIGQQVAQILERNGIQVVMTRNSDYFVDLAPRVAMAERANANLFVSIHANSVDGRSDVNGLETYYYDSGLKLAQTVHSSILQNIGTLKDRGVRRARFFVLRKSSMPSILVETGYMTGNQDNPRLGNAAYRSRMANAIAQGIIKYLQQR